MSVRSTCEGNDEGDAVEEGKASEAEGSSETGERGEGERTDVGEGFAV